MEGKMLAAAGAGALASAAVCLWFQKSTEAEAKVESAERRRAGGAREDTPMQGADAEEGVPCDSPYLAPRRAPVSSEGDELCGVTGEFDSPEPKNASLMPSPMRNVRPKTLFGDPTETCSEVALVDDHLHRLIKQGVFTLSAPSLDLAKYVQPASIDLPVHGPAYLVKEKVLPFKKKVRELLAGLILEEKPLSGDGAVLLKGQTYLVYWGRIVLPKGSRGCLSPKSSIGRIDMMVRGVVDGCGLYDIVPGDGVARELWLEISPQSFNVRLKDSIAVTQLMVFLPWDQVPCVLSAEDPSSPPSSPGQDQRLPNADSPGGSSSPQPPPQGQSVPGVAAFDVQEERLCFDPHGEPIPLQLHKGAVVLSVCVPEAPAVAGYEAIATEEVVDLARISLLDPRKFFRAIHRSDEGRLTLEKDRFYILATKERVCVPVHLSAEMVPFSHHVGELRAHYAGFFDPGFGYGRAGEIKGTVGVLEVRPHETVNIYHGQPICMMEFFRNASIPRRPYGFSGSSYQGQTGPKLAKYFSSPA